MIRNLSSLVSSLLVGHAIIVTGFLTAAFVCEANGQGAVAPKQEGAKKSPAKKAPAKKKSVEQLMRDGDRYADQKDYNSALVNYKDAYEQIVFKLRGLDFKNPVQPVLMTRKELRERMIKILDDEFTHSELKFIDRSYKAFGFVPAELDIRATMIGLYTEEVGGFYNPENKNMVLINEVQEDKEEAGRGILGRLFETPTGFNKEEQKVTLAHEMTHAAQDQHYDLHTLHQIADGDDDMQIALSALAEGDATVVMFDEQQRMSGQPPQFNKTSPRMMDLAFFTLRTLLPFASGKTFRKAPRIFKDSLIFPYHKGAVFVLTLSNKGGYKAVDKAWNDIPVSTEQILHPGKYITNRDDPVKLTLPEYKSELKGWNKLGSNVIGEFQMRILLARVPGAYDAAAGWDGDRFDIYENPQTKNVGMVWLTTWDSKKDADEFARAYETQINRKLKIEDPDPLDLNDDEKADEKVDLTVDKDGKTYRIIHRDMDVLVLEGFPEKESNSLIEKAFKAKRSTKSFDKEKFLNKK
ncbi:MAG: hypothetical protein ACI9G1_003523 [Pirellulaceae bacterium]|jgi:hypothetical protein